jgi:REP element-mobilizing transposase RayT
LEHVAQLQTSHLRVRVMPEHVHLLLSEPQHDTSGCRTVRLKPKNGLNGPQVDQLSYGHTRMNYHEMPPTIVS